MLDLIGDLSLISSAGGSTCGLPAGDIVAVQSNHALHARFCKAFLEACAEDDDGALVSPETEDEYRQLMEPRVEEAARLREERVLPPELDLYIESKFRFGGKSSLDGTWAAKQT